MSPRLDRLHVTLAVLLALGAGYRWHATRRPGREAERAVVSAQVARLGHRDGGEAGARRRRPVGARAPRASPPKTPPPEGPRVERSPVGAMAPVPLAIPTGAPPHHALVNMDAADARALEALPGIGPSLARRLVADRESHGPFGSLAALQRVKGVGPRLAERLAPHVTFGGGGRPSSVISIPVPPRGEGSLSGSRRSGRHRQ